MPTTAHEQLLTIIGNRLANITVARGYTATPKKIICAQITPFSGVDELPTINYWSVSDDVERNKYGGDQHSFEIAVEAFAVSDKSSAPLSVAASRLAGDIVTALHRTTAAPTVAAATSHALGDVITRLVFRAYDYRIGEGQEPWFAVVLQFSAIYQAPIGDVYTLEV